MNKLTLATAFTGALFAGAALGCHHNNTRASNDNYGYENHAPVASENAPEQPENPSLTQHPLQTTSQVGWQVVDATGKVIGHVTDAAGTVVNDSGQVIGKVATGTGDVISSTGETVGKLLKPGHQP